MINRQTIDRIMDTVRIEEVIGDFVTLKKRGSNYVALSPFVNEKTPSFIVSPAKGIFKDFSSGLGGDSVKFIMEHEKISYPEALRFLARKYNIEIEEEQVSEEAQKQASERELLFNLNDFAQKFFKDQLHTTEEGKAIALSYFLERGLTLPIIEKFSLGYSPNNRRAFTDYALLNGYTAEQLIKAFLTVENERGNFDRFFSRVIFPIHNVAGRVVGFGGRTLSKEKNIAKYVNSNETEVYVKSKILYGLYQARKVVVAEDNCFLVEGYMDVISMVQAGVENVVASSGTALTEDQIRLIKRYTKNITILYDGDRAGIKAAFRGIDMILQEGLNVKLVLFPDGDDPDSYSRKVSNVEFKEYIKQHARDFISFKTSLLLEEASHDPIKKAELIRDIVKSIALIPDNISRSVYLKECSRLLDVNETILIGEINTLLKKKFLDDKKADALHPDPALLPELQAAEESLQEGMSVDDDYVERDLARLIVKYSDFTIMVEDLDEDGRTITIPVTVGEFIYQALANDNIEPAHPVYRKVYRELGACLDKHHIPAEKHFIENPDGEIQHFTITAITEKYELSKNWEKDFEIVTITEDRLLKQAVKATVYSLKLRYVDKLKIELMEQLKANPVEYAETMQMLRLYDEARKQISQEEGRVILK